MAASETTTDQSQRARRPTRPVMADCRMPRATMDARVSVHNGARLPDVAEDGPVVFVVDDDASVRQSLASLIATRSGCRRLSDPRRSSYAVNALMCRAVWFSTLRFPVSIALICRTFGGQRRDMPMTHHGS